MHPLRHHPPIICNLPFFFFKGRLLRFKHEEAEEEADYIDPFQSGFGSEHRAEIILLLLLMTLIGTRIEVWSPPDLLDLLEAFDTISHRIILDLLEELGIGGTLL